MCEFFGCDYCVLLTINMLCYVQVMFIQLLNVLERYCVCSHLCLLSLYTVITPKKFTHKFYYLLIFIELYLVILDHSLVSV